ncbi:MAG: alpha-L-rhamnosidase C-terminal domain-containing protein [Blautia sp.]
MRGQHQEKCLSWLWIAPDLTCRLDWAEGSHETVYGKVWIHWEKEDDKAVLIVEIPPNTEAKWNLQEK